MSPERSPVNGPPPSHGSPEEPRDIVHYAFFRLLPSWRARSSSDREVDKNAFVRLLEGAPEELVVRTYSLVGLKADVDFLVWTIAPALEALQEFHARLRGSPLGPFLETRYSYLGMGRRSEYLGGHAHGGEGEATRRRPTDRPYLFVYPFTKKREWYGVPFEERRRIMGEHFRIGHRYPNVDIHTGYSFGLDDMEFILSFEADRPSEFLDLVSDLRPTEASRYTLLETPIFTCVRTSARRALDLAEGLA